jgi:UDP-N-acetylmuramate--alanine ligase
MYPDKKITGIFQPHLYSRTRDFADGFAESLSLLDRVILMPIYPARELPTQGVNSEMILNRMNHPNAGICSREALTEVLSQQPVDVLVTLGAGDIDREIKRLKVWMDGRNQ